jgi:glycerophosphoryl diester phosphodiesterase
LILSQNWKAYLCSQAKDMIKKLVLILALLLAGCVATSKNVKIIAHRGASGAAPENTMAAFLLAWKMGADGSECDIHLTKDQRVIISHEATTKRMCGIDMEIKNTDSKDLRNLDAGSLGNSKYKGEKLPFLEEIISTIPAKRQLLIEIKCGTEVLPYLKDIIEKSGKKKQLIIIGFELNTMKEAKKLMPDVGTYWLLDVNQDEKTKKYIAYDLRLIETAKAAGMDGLDAHYASLTKEFADGASKAGQKVYVWTVDDVNEAKRLRDIGVVGITTNKPDLLIKELKGSEARQSGGVSGKKDT